VFDLAVLAPAVRLAVRILLIAVPPNTVGLLDRCHGEHKREQYHYYLPPGHLLEIPFELKRSSLIAVWFHHGVVNRLWYARDAPCVSPW